MTKISGEDVAKEGVKLSPASQQTGQPAILPVETNNTVYNERIKLLATFISNTGIAALAGGILATIFRGQFHSEWDTEGILGIVSIVFGIGCQIAAGWVLGHL